MRTDPYEVLGVSSQASLTEIKLAYRNLVKRYHPDAGGNETEIHCINAAWELLKDPESRKIYDHKRNLNESKLRGIRNAKASADAQATQSITLDAENQLIKWLKTVYAPIDKLLGEIINPFPKQLRNLSADPYDDELMDVFCKYLEAGKRKLKKIDSIYRSNPIPKFAQDLGLSLYQCLSQVEDALNELERYTMGYVDSYLNDGREMIREAKKKRTELKSIRKQLKLS